MFEEPQKLKRDGVLVEAGTHCFLGIVCHEEGQPPQIERELHFKRPRRGNTTIVQPVLYKESRHDFENPDLKYVCHQLGDKEGIYAQWDKALKLAHMVRENPPQFKNDSAYSFNCRAFAIGALKAMELSYIPAATDAVKGVLATVWETYAPAFFALPENKPDGYEMALSV